MNFCSYILKKGLKNRKYLDKKYLEMLPSFRCFFSENNPIDVRSLCLNKDMSVWQVKKHVVQVISAMAHHGYLELEGGELLVRFIVQNCALHDTYQVKKEIKIESSVASLHFTLVLSEI